MQRWQMINLAGIVYDSIVDGPGLRTTIFFQGCEHHCKNCQNPETWPFVEKRRVSPQELYKEISATAIGKAVTLSGGDPLFQPMAVLELCKLLKEHNYNIWLYTGFLWEHISESPCMEYIDVVVDGPFIEEEKSLDVLFRGSKNQRIIDVQKSLKNKRIELFMV